MTRHEVTGGRPATMRRRIWAGVLAAGLALAAAACGDDGTAATPPEASASFAPGTTMARLAAAGKVTVGTKFEQPLFGQKGLSGEVEGFDVEIAKIIAAGLGIKEDGITFVQTTSAQREGAIERKEVDLIVASYTINDKRREKVSFAGPYYQAGQDLMIRKDNTTITGPESLRAANAKVCSGTGSTSSENIKEYVDAANIVLFDGYQKCVDALRTNQVDAVTTDDAVLLGYIGNSDGAFKLVGKPFSEEPYGIGITKGDTAFCEFIDNQLTKAAADGSYAEAWKSTAGKVATTTPSLPELDTCV